MEFSIKLIKRLFNMSFWGGVIRGVILSHKLDCCPKKLRVGKDVIVFHPQHISIGNNVSILQRAALCPLHKHNTRDYPSEIKIGNNVSIGAYNRIASAYSVTIEDDVLFAAFVHVTDHSHGYEDINQPIYKQDIIHKGPVVIKKGTWLAFGCHVLSGVTIGEHCVVAANSVVTKDVPPYSVVAGNPAKVVKRYNFDSKQWERI